MRGATIRRIHLTTLGAWRASGSGRGASVGSLTGKGRRCHFEPLPAGAFPVRRRGVRHAFEVEAPLLIGKKLTPQWKIFDTGRQNRREQGAEFLKYSKFLP